VPHVFTEVHVVRHNVDVRVEHFHLSDNFFQDVSNAGRKDEKRNVVMIECVEEYLIPLPAKRRKNSKKTLLFLSFFFFFFLRWDWGLNSGLCAHLSHTSNPFCSGYFEDGIFKLFVQTGLEL
jgi:hypothetical protein